MSERSGAQKVFLLLALLTLVAAGLVSYFAYPEPDALEHSLETCRPQETPASGARTSEGPAPQAETGGETAAAPGGAAEPTAEEPAEAVETAAALGEEGPAPKETGEAADEAGGYGGILPDYSTPGVESRFRSNATAGVLGAAVTFGVLYAVARILAAGRRRASSEEPSPSE